MFQNYITEIKELHNGEFEHANYWAWDEDADKARQKAEAKFHEILAVAATSDTASHAAILFTSEGFPLRNECYKHDPIPVEIPDITEEEPEYTEPVGE